MPAALAPPFTASEAASSPGALVMESVSPASTSMPAEELPETSSFAPASVSDTFAPPHRAKAHWPLPVARCVRFESITALVTPAATVTRTLPSVLAPEIVNGPAFVSRSLPVASS